MGKILKLEYKDVKDFKKEFRKRTGARNVDNMFKTIANKALENTIEHIMKNPNTPIQDGNYIRGWKEDVKLARKSKGEFVASATNKAKNRVAKRFGMDEFYAEYIEYGNINPAPYYEDENGKVHWHTRPKGLELLANAEIDTERKIQGIVNDEINKLFGGLFD